MDCFPILTNAGDLTTFSNAQKVEIAEYLLKKATESGGNVAQELPLTHHINNGLYAREIFLPGGIVLTGKVHNFDHLSVLSKGKVTVLTAEGLETLEAPCTWHSKAGTKRLIYVHEDTIWTTFHVTDKKTVPELEAHLVRDSDLSWIEDLNLLPGGKKCLLQQ